MRQAFAFMIVLLVIGIPARSDADQIGVGDFGGAVQTTTFDGLGLPTQGNPTPLVIDGHTITTDDGIFRYTNSAFLCVENECIGNNLDLGYIDIVLDAPYRKAGAFVTGSQAGSAVRVDFFGPTDALLGSLDISNPVNIAPLFAGWEDPGGISRVRFTDLTPNSRVEFVDNLMVETVVPEPSTALLIGCGLAALARARRRAAIR